MEDLRPRHLSWLFAKLSGIAYEEPDAGVPLFKMMGFTAKYIVVKDSECYVLTDERDLIVVCRGTQPKEFKDIKADLQAWPKEPLYDAHGKVHFGFNKYANRMLDKVRDELLANTDKRIWFCGHSLGAAMASILAIYCQVDDDLPNANGLYTYGSPKVGNAKFIAQAQFYHERWVNNIDIVTSVPPGWMGYSHFGQLKYLNHFGNYRELTTVQHMKDRIRGLITGLRKKKINYFMNHSIDAYIAHLSNYAEGREVDQTAKGDSNG